MKLRSIIDPVWKDLSDKLFQEMFAGVRRYSSGTILNLLKSSGENLIELNVSGNTEQETYTGITATGNPVSVNNVKDNFTSVILNGKTTQEGTGDPHPDLPASASGNPVALTNAKENSIASLILNGKTTQAGSGDPSPENIRPISGVGCYDKCIVLDGSDDEKWSTSSGTAFTIPLSDVVFNGKWTSNTAKSNSFRNVADPAWGKGHSGEMCVHPSIPSVYFNFNDVATDVPAWRLYLSEKPLTVWYKSTSYDTSDKYYAVAEFEDANGYHAQAVELDAPLFDGDSVDFVSGKVTRNKKCVTFDGSEGWTIGGKFLVDGSDYYYTLPGSYTRGAKIINYEPVVCSRYASAPIANSNTVQGCGIVLGNIRIRYGEEKSIESLKSELAESPITIVYELATPTETKVTPIQITNAAGDLTVTSENALDVTYKNPANIRPISGLGCYDKCVAFDNTTITSSTSQINVSTSSETTGFGGVETLSTSFFFTTVGIENFSVGTIKCSAFPASNGAYGNDYPCCGYSDTGKYITFRERKDVLYRYGDFDTSTNARMAWVAYFAANPLTVWYQSTSYDTASTYYAVAEFEDANGYHAQAVELDAPLFDGDTVDFVSGKNNNTRNIIVLTGAESWTEDTLNRTCSTALPKRSKTRDVICSHYPYAIRTDISCVRISANLTALNLTDIDRPTLATLRPYLSAQYAAGTPVTIVYELATPIVEQVTPVQITNAAGVVTISGENTLNVSTGSTPRPDYPVAIQNVGDLVTEGEHAGKYAVPVKVSGKNLLNWDLSIDDNVYGHNYYDMSIISSFGFIKSGKMYHYSAETTGDNNGVKIGQIRLYSGKATLILKMSPGEDFTGVDISSVNKVIVYGSETGSTIKKLMITEQSSSVDETYEPYHEPITTTLYLDEPLRKGDILEVVGGKLVKNRAKVVLNGKLGWWKYGDARIYVLPIAGSKIGQITSRCDSYINVASIFSNQIPGTYCDHPSLNYRYFATECDTLEEFKADLNRNPIILEYELAEPKIIQIDPTQIPTFEGTTIVEVLTETQPESMTATYWKEN